MRRLTLWWRRFRGWTLIVVGAGCGAAATALSARWFPGPAALVVGAVTAALFGVLSTRGTAAVRKRAERIEALPSRVSTATESGWLRKVSDLNDPIALRVHPAAARERVVDRRSVVDHVPGYVPRDVQDELEAALSRGGFVLVTGDSAAGKTRAAYEAVRKMLPDHVLLAPVDRQALTSVVSTVLERRHCVVWLDDLERFLGAEGLTATSIRRMVGDGDRRVVLVGTMRSAEYERFSMRRAAEATEDIRDSWQAGRDVVNLASLIPVQRQWSPKELERAMTHADDHRIYKALGKTARFGVAEILAAGPELVNDWHNAWRVGGHPRGAALVAAAVDCRRVGIHEPVPAPLLFELAESYLEQRGGRTLRPEPLKEAVAWATTPVQGTSSLLVPGDVDGHYIAFDYLIDLPGNPVVPAATWTRLIEWADPSQAAQIGMAADQMSRPEAAVAAFGKAAEHGVPDADLNLARAHGARGDLTAAVAMLQAILDRRERELGPAHDDTVRARHQVANYLGWSGRPAEAVEMFRELARHRELTLGADHAVTLHTRWRLATYTGHAGDPAAAVALLRDLLGDCVRALGPHHEDTFMTRHQLAGFTGHGGDPVEALRLYRELLADRRQIAGNDHPETLGVRHRIATYVERVEGADQALPLFRELLRDQERVLGAEHPNALRTRQHIASCAARCGQADQARRDFAALLEEQLRILGPDHPDVLSTRYHAASFHLEHGEPGQGAALLAGLLDDCTRVFGPDHPDTVRVRDALSG